jgi:hypothetical protein
MSSAGGLSGWKPSSWDLATPRWSASRSPAQVVVVDDRQKKAVSPVGKGFRPRGTKAIRSISVLIFDLDAEELGFEIGFAGTTRVGCIHHGRWLHAWGYRQYSSRSNDCKD